MAYFVFQSPVDRIAARRSLGPGTCDRQNLLACMELFLPNSFLGKGGEESYTIVRRRISDMHLRQPMDQLRPWRHKMVVTGQSSTNPAFLSVFEGGWLRFALLCLVYCSCFFFLLFSSSDENFQIVVAELGEYVTDVDADMGRKAIR